METGDTVGLGDVNGDGYDDVIVFENAGLIMVNSQIEYLSETAYGEELRVGMGISKASSKAIDLTYGISKIACGKEVARVHTRLLFFDYDAGAVTTIPDGFIARLRQQGIEL